MLDKKNENRGVEVFTDTDWASSITDKVYISLLYLSVGKPSNMEE